MPKPGIFRRQREGRRSRVGFPDHPGASARFGDRLGHARTIEVAALPVADEPPVVFARLILLAALLVVSLLHIALALRAARAGKRFPALHLMGYAASAALAITALDAIRFGPVLALVAVPPLACSLAGPQPVCSRSVILSANCSETLSVLGWLVR